MSSIFNSMAISASALTAQRVRMNVLSKNLANAQSTSTPEGGPYRREDVVFSAVPLKPDFASLLDESTGAQLTKVQVVDIHKDTQAPKRVYNPGHPDADAKGYVAMPNIEPMTEMVNMIMATRAFEANATAMNQAKQLAMRSLDIGR